VLATSISFANSVRTIYGALLNGSAVYPFDVRKGGFGKLAAWLRDHDITIIRNVPTFFRNFMATLGEAESFPAIRVLSLGGEPMLRDDLAYFNRHFASHCVLSHAFGPTECLTVCWALIPHGTTTAEGKLPIGYSLRDKDVLLLDASRRRVDDGEIGEIAVRSRHISPGYWRDTERTQQAFMPTRTAATRAST
jgi:non-ribosomal peptide synthetase component F